MNSKNLPFLKWPGGKRWLAHDIVRMIQPELNGRYFEPFLGGGAVFFTLKPDRAVLSDINGDLINTYVQVRSHYKRLIEEIRKRPINAEEYNRIRARRLLNPLKRAADFLYLNRTAWGGMYRVNSEGKFNVPFGGGERTPNILWERGLLASAAESLKNSQIAHCDFEDTLKYCGAGDVAFCDPTYTVAHDQNGFVRYNENNFSWEDQIRLARACSQAVNRGAYILVSNAHHESLRYLYRGAGVRIFTRNGAVSTIVEKRGRVKEHLFILSKKARLLNAVHIL